MHLNALRRIYLGSGKVKEFLLLMGILLGSYGLGFYSYIRLRMLGESNPETWASLSAFLNGMSIQFSLEKASPMLSTSLELFVVSLVLLVGFFLLRWQVLRTTLLGVTLLSMAYLLCTLLLLVFTSALLHGLVLITLAGLFAWGFVVQSNLPIYWYDRD